MSQTLKSHKYTGLKGLLLKGDAQVGNGAGAIAFPSLSAGPNPTDGYTVYVEGGSLKFWNGSSAVTIGAAGTSGGSLDTAYDNGRTIDVNQGSVTLAGDNEDTAVLSITLDGASSGAGILIANSGSGNDVTGTSSTWAVTKAGVITAVGLTMSDDQAITLGASADATIQWVGASNYTDVHGAVNFDSAITMEGTTTVTMTGSGGSTVATITAGDVVMSDGSIAITDADNAASFSVTNNTATTIGAAASGGVASLISTSLTTGALLNLQLTEGTLNGGWYIRAWDATAGAAVFKVGEDGATTITGAGGSNMLTVTAGDVVLSDGSITVTDADDAASLSITNNSAATAALVKFTGSGTFTGTTTNAFVAITPTGLSTGTGLYVATAAATTLSHAVDVTTSTTTGTAMRLTTTGVQTGVGSALEIIADSATTPGASAGEGVVKISADGLTTGTALDVTSTAGNALTTGRIADFSHISGNITGTLNKTADFFNVSSARTVTTGTVADDYDMMNLIRTSVINGGGTFSATGSVLYVENAVTNTSGTVSDTVNGIQVVMDSLGTGDGISLTHAATGGKALNIVGAATSVSDVLITGSGVKADNKASLEVTNSGATAAGGSVLRVTATGTPADATSYLVDFDNSGATMTNNPVAVHIDSGASTAAGLQITGSGAPATGNLQIASTATGALGAVINLDQAANSAANSDVIGRLLFTGLDDANAAESYARIDTIIRDVSAANPDASLNFLVDRAGTLTLGLTVGWDTVAGAALNGISVGDGSGAAVVSSQGAQDLTLETNGGTNSGTITITDAANGNITLTPNGTGLVDVAGAAKFSATETIAAGGTSTALSLAKVIHWIDADAGGDTFTLADGVIGQIAVCVMKSSTGTATITPANMHGGTSVTFNAAGDSVILMFVDTKWAILGGNSYAVA